MTDLDALVDELDRRLAAADAELTALLPGRSWGPAAGPHRLCSGRPVPRRHGRRVGAEAKPRSPARWFAAELAEALELPAGRR